LTGDRLLVFQTLGRSLFTIKSLKTKSSFLSMGLIKLRVKEFAAEKGWTLKEVSDRSGVIYSTLTTYSRSPGMAMVDVTCLLKLARTFDVMVEDLIEVVKE
jgi:putative transcriptional regulator